MSQCMLMACWLAGWLQVYLVDASQGYLAQQTEKKEGRGPVRSAKVRTVFAAGSWLSVKQR